jgi:hypothetical protein
MSAIGSSGTGLEKANFLMYDTGTARVQLAADTGNPSWINAGNVGIGTTDPKVKTHVYISSPAGSPALPNSTYDAMVIEGDVGTNINIINGSAGTTQGSAILFSDDTRARGSLGYYHRTSSVDADYMFFTTAGIQRMWIDANGNMGVGTIAPGNSSRCEVNRTYGSANGYVRMVEGSSGSSVYGIHVYMPNDGSDSFTHEVGGYFDASDTGIYSTATTAGYFYGAVDVVSKTTGNMFEVYHLNTSNLRFGVNDLGRIYSSGTYSYDVSSQTYKDCYITSGGYFGVITSSIKYKKNISELDSYSKKIYQLKPVSFEFKEGNSGIHFGLIAEECEKVLKELVTYSETGEVDSVCYSKLIPLLLNEIINLKKEIDMMKG